MWSTIHGDPLLGPVWLDEVVNTKRYLQLLNHTSEIHVDKMPHIAQCQFSFQHEGAPLHCNGKVQNLSSSQEINWVQRSNQMTTKIPGLHSHTLFLLGSSEVTCVPYLPMYNGWPASKYPHCHYRHHNQNSECVWCCMWCFINLCEQQEGQFEYLPHQCFPLHDWTYGTPGIWWWEANYSYSDILFGIIN